MRHKLWLIADCYLKHSMHILSYQHVKTQYGCSRNLTVQMIKIDFYDVLETIVSVASTNRWTFFYAFIASQILRLGTILTAVCLPFAYYIISQLICVSEIVLRITGNNDWLRWNTLTVGRTSVIATRRSSIFIFLGQYISCLLLFFSSVLDSANQIREPSYILSCSCQFCTGQKPTDALQINQVW